VSAIIRCKKSHAENLKAHLYNLVDASRNEKACLQFDLFQSVTDQNVFIVEAEWLEQFWFEIYTQQEYVNHFNLSTEKMMERDIEIIICNKIT
jgi:quinol monooxygenase YgiN